MTPSSHAAVQASERPTPAQLSELFRQVDVGKVTKDSLQAFLRQTKSHPLTPFQRKLDQMFGRISTLQENSDGRPVDERYVWVSWADGKAFIGSGCYKKTLLAAVHKLSGLEPDQQALGWVVSGSWQEEIINVRFSDKEAPFNMLFMEKDVIWVC